MNVPSTTEYGIRNVAADTGLQRFSFILTKKTYFPIVIDIRDEIKSFFVATKTLGQDRALKADAHRALCYELT